MPLNRPTPQELIARAAADIESRLPGADARLRRSVLGVLAKQHALAMHLAYGNIDWLSRQVLPDTCDSSMLDRVALWRAGLTRLPATFAAGSVTFTGNNGATIPAATELQRSDAVVFVTAADGVIAGGTVTVAVTAKVAGAAGNTAAASALSLISAISGVNTNGVVAAGGLVGGSDVESDTNFRPRVLERIQKLPQGGAPNDYVTWAKEVAGVTRAWSYPIEGGAGTVTVRFMTDDLTADGIPSAGLVSQVQAYINLLRPATANVTVAAPVAVPLNFTITPVPGTQAVKDAIQAELKDLIRREAQPGGILLISHIREAISLSAGEDNYVLATPTADVSLTVGQITTMGVITWS